MATELLHVGFGDYVTSTIFRSGRLVLLALQPETVASRLAELHSGDQHDE